VSLQKSVEKAIRGAAERFKKKKKKFIKNDSPTMKSQDKGKPLDDENEGAENQ
jgi:hypothetical protein